MNVREWEFIGDVREEWRDGDRGFAVGMLSLVTLLAVLVVFVAGFVVAGLIHLFTGGYWWVTVLIGVALVAVVQFWRVVLR